MDDTQSTMVIYMSLKIAKDVDIRKLIKKELKKKKQNIEVLTFPMNYGMGK